ncbi:S41 family peptidase [Porticoccus sp. W117]|uniref:S41 family peptidase n=1 Tax=Porticoccus sp. W117 TaxID=3054777 RepID=UPI002596102D|nr:S41 family peptidase [Porticoccus sp. W117]MDM3871653.1 S41 family peptidase [Porticoccus sp. W117]
MKITNNVLLLLSAALLSACGGGGGGSDNSGQTTPPAFQQGVFQAASNFEARCQTPRTGTNPATGTAYPDRQGSTLQENNWLRSWSNDLYLWYDEIVDRNPADFSDTESYFEQLKTNALTSSGNPRDQFHFTFDTERWRQLSQSGVSAGYGANFAVLQTTPPRRIVVAYVEPGSPAANAGLSRGTEVLRVDGVDAVNGGTQADVDVINAGLSPSAAGQSHTFVVQDVGATSSYSVTLQSGNITSTPVLTTDIINTSSGDVGYILFNDHIATAEQQLLDAVTQMANANITDLVLDLRYNGGGFLSIASQMAYMIAGSSATSGRTFENLVFNDKHRVNNPVTGERLAPSPFRSTTTGLSATAGQALPSLNLSRVFVLTTADTCSASEAIINGLRGINVEVIQIGSTTCGKPYGFYPQDNCGTTYFTIQFAGENDVGFSDYSDGFSPANATSNVGEPVAGCAVADDYSRPLGDPAERLLATALQYRIDRTCPTPSAIVARQRIDSGAALEVPGGGVVGKPLWLQNRILERN